VLAIELGAVAYNLFELAPAYFPTASGALAYTLSYAVALGFHAPIVVLHIQGDRSATYVQRAALAWRGEAIYETHDRLAASRAAFAAACSSGRPSPDSFPTTVPLAHRAGLSMRFLALVAEDLVAAGSVEFVLASAWGLGPRHATQMLAQVSEAVDEAASRLRAEGRDRFAWREAFEDSAVGPDTFLAPISMTIFSVLRDLTWDQARETLRFARSIADGAAPEERPQHQLSEGT
jgi:hypothetical protein